MAGLARPSNCDGRGQPRGFRAAGRLDDRVKPGHDGRWRALKPQHQLQVLHRRAGRAFAEIVEFRRQHRLPPRLVVVDVDQHVVRAVERLRLEAQRRGGLLGARHLDVLRARVVGGERGAQVGALRLARQRVEMQRRR